MKPLSVAWLLVAFLAARPAEACSPAADAFVPAPPCVEPELSGSPTDGAVGMPTNVLLAVFSDARAIEPILRRASDATDVSVIAAGRYYWRAEPALLEPETTYELWTRRPSTACTGAGELARVAAFSTGGGPDVTPPAPPIVRGVTACGVDECPSSTCCGPYSVTSWRLDWSPSPDDDVRYHETAEGESFPTRYGTWFAGFAYPTARFDSAAGSPTLSIVAVDHAGNRSVATRPIDASRCNASRDAGVTSGPGGCAVRHEQPGGATIAMLLAVLAIHRRRARRRR